MASERPQSPPDLNERLARLKDYIARYKGYERAWPPLPESTVRELEEKHRIRLPEDYRAYITQVANGGPGPLRSLQDTLDFRGQYTTPSRPCMLHPDGEYWTEWEQALKTHSYDDGILPIANSVCGEIIGLIVTGPGRGRVMGEMSGHPVYIADDEGFVDFYLRWFEDRRNRRPHIHPAPNFDYITVDLFYRGCSEEELLATATLNAPEPAAFRALLLLDSIGPSERSLPLIREAARDPRPKIRSNAAPLLQQLQTDSELFTLLQDDEWEVRDSAAFAIGTWLGYRPRPRTSLTRSLINWGIEVLRPPFRGGRHEVRNVQEDPVFARFDDALIAQIQIESDPRVYSWIADILEYRGKLTTELLLAPTARHPGICGSAATALKSADLPQDLSLAISLFINSDAETRFDAIIAFRRWGKPAITALRQAWEQEEEPARKAQLETALEDTQRWIYPW
jgi:hypothetical protein